MELSYDTESAPIAHGEAIITLNEHSNALSTDNLITDEYTVISGVDHVPTTMAHENKRLKRKLDRRNKANALGGTLINSSLFVSNVTQVL